MKNPFKFLDSFTEEDKEIFFGRDKETEELYQKVFESKVLLVYGVSGTGKSSLIHCGLANKFNDSDWLPINIRRGANINESLLKSIEKEITSTTSRNDENRKQLSLKKQLRNLYLDNFKPIYLIFDQFEELFIFGSKPEREDFIKSVKTIVDSDLNCKFLFVIREEYLAGITEFEKQLPQIMQNRIRIEKMGRSNAVQAIEGPCKYANINLEEGFSEALIEKLSPESAEVELTYLQVYLDKLYRSTEISPLLGEMPKAEGFTIQLIESFGDVKDLLGSFLDEQIDELENLDEGLTILKAFVSSKGTKRQITESEVKDYALTLGKKIESEQLKSLIQKFISLRILRDKDENNRYELRHDALAAKIYEKITLVEKELLEVRQFIEHAFDNYKRRKVLLNKTDLSYIAPYEDKIYFGKELNEFLNKSKHEAEKTKRRRRILISATAIVLLLIFAGFSWWALNERDKAQLNEKKAIANNFNFLAKEVLATDPTKALRLAEYAYSLDTTNKSIYRNLLNIYYNNPISRLIIKGHENWVNTVCFSPNGKTILTGSDDKTARLWNLNGNLLQVFKGHEDRISSVCFSPDGKSILTGSDDKSARLWDLNGNLLQLFKGHADGIMSVCFSPDGKSILTGSDDETARLWDLNGNLLQVFKGHEDGLSSVCFSPDGKSILTGSWDKTARLWDLNGNLLQIFKAYEDGIRSVCFSPNGKTILTGYLDKTALIWDLNGNHLQLFKGHEGGIISVCFSPDGKSILTGSADKTARLWDVRTSYEEFIILGEYAELSIRDKLEYGICDFDNVSKLKVVDDIFEAALFYFNNLNELSDINKKQNYLNNAEKLFDKISKDSIQIKHLLKYQKLLIIKYQEQADTKYIQKINDIHKQLIENDIPDDLLIIADAYLFIFNNSNLGDISEFDIFEKLIEICKKILDEKDVAKYINNRISEILSYVSSNLLLVDKFEQAKQAAFLAKQANPDNSFLYTKLALAYLLTDDWQKAKAVYVTWKDKSYIYNDNEKLMRDAFLEDLDALESKDITHPDFDQVRELLKEEKTENNE